MYLVLKLYKEMKGLLFSDYIFSYILNILIHSVFSWQILCMHVCVRKIQTFVVRKRMISLFLCVGKFKLLMEHAPLQSILRTAFQFVPFC